MHVSSRRKSPGSGVSVSARHTPASPGEACAGPDGGAHTHRTGTGSRLVASVVLTLHRQPIHSRRCVEYSGKLHHLSGVALLARASIHAKVQVIRNICHGGRPTLSDTRSRALAVSLGGSQAHNSPDRTNDRTRTRANFTVSRVRRRGGANLGVP